MPKVKFDLDLSFIEKAMIKLSDTQELQHISRSVALAGARVLRDEAKERVPVKSGRLKEAIYLAYDDSNGIEQAYDVSWNKKKAPHGHLIEHGHWLVRGKKLGARRIKWVAAKPFLRPAYDVTKTRIQVTMNQRTHEKIRELVKK